MNLSWNWQIALPAFSSRVLGYALALVIAPNVVFLLLSSIYILENFTKIMN